MAQSEDTHSVQLLVLHGWPVPPPPVPVLPPRGPAENAFLNHRCQCQSFAQMNSKMLERTVGVKAQTGKAAAVDGHHHLLELAAVVKVAMVVFATSAAMMAVGAARAVILMAPDCHTHGKRNQSAPIATPCEELVKINSYYRMVAKRCEYTQARTCLRRHTLECCRYRQERPAWPWRGLPTKRKRAMSPPRPTQAPSLHIAIPSRPGVHGPPLPALPPATPAIYTLTTPHLP